MKRFLAIAIVLLVPIGVAVLLWASEQGFPEHARSVLRQYTDRPIQQVSGILSQVGCDLPWP